MAIDLCQLLCQSRVGRRGDSTRARRRAWMRRIGAVPPAMWRRRSLCILVLYLILLVIMFKVSPELPNTFLDENHRVHYPLLFLSSAAGEPYSDAAAAEVFTSRRCGGCFLTNNKGFMPLADYDAVLVHGNRDLLSETIAFMDPGKRYLIETSLDCISNKLQCGKEPKVTSFSSREEYTLCSLCDELLRNQQKVLYSRITYIEDWVGLVNEVHEGKKRRGALVPKNLNLMMWNGIRCGKVILVINKSSLVFIITTTGQFPYSLISLIHQNSFSSSTNFT